MKKICMLCMVVILAGCSIGGSGSRKDYRALFAGSVESGGESAWRVQAYTAHGVLDNSWNMTFDSNSGDDRPSILIKRNSDIYIIGTRHNGSDTDVWVKKFKENGIEDNTWDLQIAGDPGSDDIPTGAVFGTSGNLYVFASTAGTTGNDWLVFALDTSGAELWRVTFDGSVGDDISGGIALSLTGGSLYLGGSVLTADGLDWWIKKIDTADGSEDVSWNKMLGGVALGNDYLVTLEINREGYLFAVGAMENSSGNLDWCIKKFGEDGVEKGNWGYLIDYQGLDDIAYAIICRGDGSVIVGGDAGVALDTDWWLKKFDPNGNELWEVTVGEPAFSEHLYALGMSPDKKIFAGGSRNTGIESDWMIKSFDNEGNEYAEWDIVLDFNAEDDTIYVIGFLEE